MQVLHDLITKDDFSLTVYKFNTSEILLEHQNIICVVKYNVKNILY